MSHELKRKDIQVKELQARLDTGDGCKLIYQLTMTRVRNIQKLIRTISLWNSTILSIFVQVYYVHNL